MRGFSVLGITLFVVDFAQAYSTSRRGEAPFGVGRVQG